MARFHIQTAHAPEQCLSTLDDFVAIGPSELSKWDIACVTGDHSNHVAYRTVDAADADAARTLVPQTVRATAQVTEVGTATAEQVAAFHQM